MYLTSHDANSCHLHWVTVLYWDTHTYVSSELLTFLPTVIPYLQYTKKWQEACLYIFSVCRQIQNWCNLLSCFTCSPQVGKCKHHLHADWRDEYIAIFPSNSLQNGTRCKTKDKTTNRNIISIFSDQTLHDGWSPLCCDAMPMGKYCTFQRTVMTSPARSRCLWNSLTHLSNLQDECTMVFQNIRNYIPSNTVSHHVILALSPPPPPPEPQLSHITWCLKQGPPVNDR